MQTVEEISLILQQLGEDIEQITAIVEEEPGSWQLHFEDGCAFTIGFSEERRSLELVAVLGIPDPSKELDVLRTMLCYQLIWCGSTEPRIALDANLGSLICLCELDLQVAAMPEFANRLLDFWLQSATLTEMVASGASMSLPPPSAEVMRMHA